MDFISLGFISFVVSSILGKFIRESVCCYSFNMDSVWFIYKTDSIDTSFYLKPRKSARQLKFTSSIIKTIELNVEPDSDGLFSFVMPISKANVRFKLLTCGDIDDIEKILEHEKEINIPVNNATTYKLENMIVEVNGETNKTMIRDFVNYMRVGDSKAFNKYVDSIDTGIDLNIEVGTPGGGSIKTFLPLNLGFFWPDARI
jgi:hypothetical protein